MSVALPFKNDRWRKALVAATFGEWSMEWTLVVDLVTIIGEGGTILALLIWLMLTFTF